MVRVRVRIRVRVMVRVRVTHRHLQKITDGSSGKFNNTSFS